MRTEFRKTEAAFTASGWDWKDDLRREFEAWLERREGDTRDKILTIVLWEEVPCTETTKTSKQSS